jgi:glycosyltransferase involved in cell wall biosynthesis
MLDHGESGLLVPPRDPDALGAAVERLLTDSALARHLAWRAETIVARRYEPVARAKVLLDLYAEVVGDRCTS